LASLGNIRRDKINRLFRPEFYHNVDRKPTRSPAEHQASLALWVTLDNPAGHDGPHHVGNRDAVLEAFCERMVGDCKRFTLYEGTDLFDLHTWNLDTRHLELVTWASVCFVSPWDLLSALLAGGAGPKDFCDIGAAIEQAAESADTGASRKWVGELSRYLDRVEIVSD
jgi:hypothetical protein